MIPRDSSVVKAGAAPLSHIEAGAPPTVAQCRQAAQEGAVGTCSSNGSMAIP